MLKNVNLMSQQISAVEFLEKNKGIGALFHEVGCGKTISSLATFAYFKSKYPSLIGMVICPISLIEGAWIKEIEKVSDYNWMNFHNGTYKHQNKPIDIIIVNFDSFVSLRKFDNIKSLMMTSAPAMWMAIIDESSKMKNKDSITTERLLEMRDYFRYRIIMSGEPAPNIEWEYWPQMKFLGDDILGKNFYKFRNTYFSLARGTQIAQGQFMNKAAMREMFKEGWKYQLLKDKQPEMYERMRPWCHSVKARECMDLPEEIDEFRILEMKDEQLKAYKKMKEELIVELKSSESFSVATTALTKLMKLRQITSAFLIDEFHNPIKIMHDNPKMKALEDVIEECGKNQMIIWCQFRFEIRQIKELLQGNVSELHGGIPQADRINQINDFLSGKNRFLLAHPDSAAHGLTFTNCHIQVFYSMSYSLEEYVQARGRTMRYGQKNNCIYFHLMCKNTIDEDILKILQRKATIGEIADKYLKA